MAYRTILPNECLELSQQQHLKSRTTLLTVSDRTCTRFVGPRHKVLISWSFSTDEMEFDWYII